MMKKKLLVLLSLILVILSCKEKQEYKRTYNYLISEQLPDSAFLFLNPNAFSSSFEIAHKVKEGFKGTSKLVSIELKINDTIHQIFPNLHYYQELNYAACIRESNLIKIRDQRIQLYNKELPLDSLSTAIHQQYSSEDAYKKIIEIMFFNQDTFYLRRILTQIILGFNSVNADSTVDLKIMFAPIEFEIEKTKNALTGTWQSTQVGKAEMSKKSIPVHTLNLKSNGRYESFFAPDNYKQGEWEVSSPNDFCIVTKSLNKYQIEYLYKDSMVCRLNYGSDSIYKVHFKRQLN